MGKVLEYIKNMISNQDKKKVVENCIIFIIIGILIIITGGAIIKRKDTGIGREYLQENRTNTGYDKESIGILKDNEDYSVEEKLEKILSQIAGAGKVSVMITYVSGDEKVPAYDIRKSENNTNEKDENGGGNHPERGRKIAHRNSVVQRPQFKRKN